MRTLGFSINVTLDGCYDHRVGIADEDLHRNAAAQIARADVMILGRNTYELMESAWRTPSPEMPAWTLPFAKTISDAKKYVVSTTLQSVDWNSELVRGDLATFVRKLKEEPGDRVAVGGAKLAFALTELKLIDEYEIVVHPVVAGHGPTLFAGLSERLSLKLIDRLEFRSGAVAMRYVRT